MDTLEKIALIATLAWIACALAALIAFHVINAYGVI